MSSPEAPPPNRPKQSVSIFQVHSQSVSAVTTLLNSIEIYNSQIIQLNESIKNLQIEIARLKKLVPHKLLPPKIPKNTRRLPPTKSK